MPTEIYTRKPFIEEHKRNISESRLKRKIKLGYINSPETRKKISKALRGKKLSEEHKRKIAQNSVRFWLGKKFSDETKRKMMGNKNGIGNKGKKRTEAVKIKMSKARKGKYVGEKSPNWKGGVSKINMRIWREKNMDRVLFWNSQYRAKKQKAEGSYTFGEWELLKKQYRYRCPRCSKSEPEIKLTVDHIIPLSKGGSNYIENIQPLCRSCNCKKHTNMEKYNFINQTEDEETPKEETPEEEGVEVGEEKTEEEI